MFERLFGTAVSSRGDVVVAGATGAVTADLDAYVAKFNAEGDAQWESTWGGADMQIASVPLACSDGDTVVAGQFASGISLFDESHESAGKTDVFVVKLGPSPP